MGQLIACAALGAITLVGAVWVVTLPNLFRAALSLGVTLLGVAGLFVLLEAEFVAFVQILVYVGAVLTLIIFAIMLTSRLQTDPEAGASRQRAPAAACALVLFVVLTATTQRLLWPSLAGSSGATLTLLGQRLVKEWVLPFEVVSLVLVAVMVGAIAIAAPRRGHEKR